MKLNPEIYQQLVSFLAGLYDAKSSPRIVRGSGLDPVFINFEQSAINVWAEVVTQAENNNRVEPLLQLVGKEFNNDMLKFFVEKISKQEAYVQAAAPQTRPAHVMAGAGSSILNCLVSVTRLTGMGSGNGCFISAGGNILTASFIFDKTDTEVMVQNKVIGTVKARIIQSWPDSMTALLKIEPESPCSFLSFSQYPPAVPDISTLAGFDYEHLKPILVNGRYLHAAENMLYYEFPYTGKGLAGAPIVNDLEEILGMFVTRQKGGKGQGSTFGAISAALIQDLINS